MSTTEQADQPTQELRRRFIEIAKSLDPRRLVFLYESGSRIAMTRDYARAPCGDRALGCVPRNSGTVTTMIGALDLRRVRALMTIERATDAEVFETFVEQVLARKLRPGDIVVLDNLGAYKVPNAGWLIDAAGAPLSFLPPYSPDLNPTELCWSKLKSILKDFGARTQQALDRAIRTTMDVIGFDDAVARFTHGGYGAQVK